jgi:glycosyltransferase involved in cell wall biosynthesis
MHIAMIGCRGIPATYGGVEKVVEELAVRLVRQGHQVTVLCRCHYTPKMSAYENVRLVRLPTIRQKHLEMIVHTLLSALYISMKPCDVVHVHSVEPAVVAPLLCWFHPVVATSHGQTYRRDKWGRVFKALCRVAERVFIAAPDKCTAVSRTLSTYYTRTYGRAVEYIPNGVTPPEPAGPELLQPFGLEPDKYILFVGRLLATKGPKLLIDAYNRIRPGLKLVLAGGSSHTARYERLLRRQANDDILFLGYQYGAFLRALYAHCRVFVFPSYIEGLPLVLLEALSYLRPVVYSDIPENREIADGLGIPFRCGSVADLAEKLQYALADSRCGEAARRTVSERLSREYNWDRVVDQYVRVYHEALALRGAADVPAWDSTAHRRA